MVSFMFIGAGILAGSILGYIKGYKGSRFFGMLNGLGIGAFIGLILTIAVMIITLLAGH